MKKFTDTNVYVIVQVFVENFAPITIFFKGKVLRRRKIEFKILKLCYTQKMPFTILSDLCTYLLNIGGLSEFLVRSLNSYNYSNYSITIKQSLAALPGFSIVRKF